MSDYGATVGNQGERVAFVPMDKIASLLSLKIPPNTFSKVEKQKVLIDLKAQYKQEVRHFERTPHGMTLISQMIASWERAARHIYIANEVLRGRPSSGLFATHGCIVTKIGNSFVLKSRKLSREVANRYGGVTNDYASIILSDSSPQGRRFKEIMQNSFDYEVEMYLNRVIDDIVNRSAYKDRFKPRKNVTEAQKKVEKNAYITYQDKVISEYRKAFPDEKLKHISSSKLKSIMKWGVKHIK